MSTEPFIDSSDIKASLKYYPEILDFTIHRGLDPDPNSFMLLLSTLIATE